MKKRNELVILEELKLKPPKAHWSAQHKSGQTPNESELKKIDNIYFYKNPTYQTVTYWKIFKSGKIVQVNQYGEVIFSGDDGYVKFTPSKASLKKFNTKVMIFKDQIEDNISWWVKDKNNKFIQVNTKDNNGEGISFWINSWIRDEAIKLVSLEVRNLKKNLNDYKHEQLEELVIEKEKEIKKKYTWKMIKGLALTSMGLNFLNF